MAPTTLSALAQQGFESFCNTPACIALSKTLLSNVNFDVDPCSDFFQFACGGWLNTEPVKENTDSYSILAQTEEKNTQSIISILNGTFEDLYKIIRTDDVSYYTQDEKDIDKENFELVQDYYNLCIDTEAQSQVGVTPIYKYLAQIEHSLFPNADEIDPNRLATALAAMKLQEIPTILEFQSILSQFDKSQQILQILTPRLDSEVDYTSVDSLNTYKETLVSLLSPVLGGPSSDDSTYGRLMIEESKKNNFTFWSSSRIQQSVSKFIDFEIQLNSITEMSDSNVIDDISSFGKLKKISDLVDWEVFLSTITSSRDFITLDLPVVFKKKHLRTLDSILAETPVKTLQEYFIIQTVKTKNDYLTKTDSSLQESSPSTDLNRQLNTVFQAPSSKDGNEENQQTKCGTETTEKFRNIVGRFFALSTVGASKAKKQADEFVQTLHSTWIHDVLPKTEWAGKETMNTIIEKAENVNRKVLYSTVSPDWRSPAFLEEYHEGISLGDNYLDAINSQKNWQNSKLWKKLTFPVNKKEWTAIDKTLPYQVNAVNFKSTNAVEIPVGIFQPPFYSQGYPEYINYGNLGYVIGHELTHSIDNSGLFFDKEGYILKDSIIADEDKTTYENKTKCFADQYSKFSLLGLKNEHIPLNGKFVLDENIADNGGIRIAYNAYFNHINKKNAPEKPIRGFEKYTPEQMFFISFSQFTCATYSKGTAQNDINTDLHSPQYYRNIGTLQNSVEFSKVFNCPIGSPMNPEKKCSIW